MNIVMVAARNFPTIKAAPDLCRFIEQFDRERDVIYTRMAKGGPDQFIAEAAKLLGYKVRGWKGEGGPSNYIRDVEMVENADVVHAFFAEDHVGEGGTQHVVDKSLDQGKLTYSYIWTNRYGITLVGSSDGGEGVEGKPVPIPAGTTKATGEATSERTRSRSESPEDWAGTGGGSSRERRPVYPGAHPED